MTDERLIKLVKNLPTGADLVALQKAVIKVQQGLIGVDRDLVTLKKEMRTGFDEVKERLDELKATAEVTDKMLERHHIKRIERIEPHLNLPKSVAATEEE